jgi:hypothetical protein
VHDEPYITDEPEPVVEREIFMPDCPGKSRTKMIAQVEVAKDPVTFVKVRAHGDNLAKQLCNSIFGMDKGIGPIIPCGEIGLGGSVLVGTGPELLLCELEYILDESDTVLVVFKKVDDAPVNYWITGSMNTAAPNAIYIDVENNQAGRICYPQGKGHLLKAHYNAIPGDLVNEPNLLPRTNPPSRNYMRPDPEQAAREYRMIQQKIIDQPQPATKHGRDERPNREMPPYDYVPLDLDNVDTLNEMPLIEPGPYIGVYDRERRPAGSKYPAPHHFANETDIMRMRELKTEGAEVA